MPLPLSRRTLVLRDLKEAGQVSYRAVDLHRGSLRVVGHDVGGQYDEYEFERRLTRDETSALARLLGVPRGSLLEAIRERFGDTPALETFLSEQGLDGRFWNRIG